MEFKKALTVKADQKLSGKDVKKLVADLQRHHEPDAVSALLTKKELSLRKTSGGVTAKLYCEGAAVLLFEVGATLRPLPTLQALWRQPSLLTALVVPAPVSEYLINFADLMTPGILAATAPVDALQVGDPLCVVVEGNPCAFAVGRLAMRGAELAAALQQSPRPKGRALETLHVFGDALWKYAEKPIPNDGFLVAEDGSKAVVPLDGGDGDGASADADADEGGGEADALADALANALADAAVDTEADRAAMDDRLRACFLYAATTLKDKQLPLPINLFYSQHLRPLRPAGTSLDVKASRWKKLGTFLQAMADEGLCEVGVPPAKKGAPKGSGELCVRAFVRDADAYRAFVPWEATAAAAEADGGGGAAPLRADDVYRPREHQRAVFDALGLADRKAVYTRDEAVAVLERHAEQHAGPSASKALTLDPILCDALYKGASGAPSPLPTSLPLREATKLWVERLEPWTRVSGGALEKPLLRPGGGGGLAITISTAQRRGHHVTLVSDLEPFAIDPNALASALQARAGASAVVQEIEGVKQAVMRREVMLQGLWDRAVAEVLAAPPFGVPPRCISNKANSKMNQKKEKAATNVRRS